MLFSVKQTAKLVVAEKFKGVTILSINRPEKQNAMNEALLHELASQLTQFEEDNSSSVAVIHGLGGNFSTGYDIDELKQRSQHDTNNVQNSLVVCFTCIHAIFFHLNLSDLTVTYSLHYLRQ